ncbi:TetR family transcriptional regulator [Caldibacillus sp. 210928-DFI.2.22]|uniref:TetR/AcrR family transcriptional regulator n=1 Tax=unclassified Caldibacillus TaxID=2641266 RepID=UPI001D096B9D|nr:MULTISPECIES: TetR/AcrR family transcriptional regulator [unclassified Caldibacillus]MCB7071479.1 TetR family transcriptional regulator [Caldibacillus sp. 210928-DFI.2.22]MCB7074907.1 TetR family transcriptional regulator [Caldibacillus sp. 210928-DFI.2.18]
MPKIVDHDNRKKAIAEATWQVILEQGMKGATVRNIARKAGLSLGALRHYFSTQEELLIYAMDLVKERVAERVEKIALKNLPPKEMILQMLLEIVPTNETTRAEMEVWLEFVLYFRNKGNRESQNDGIFEGIQKLLDSLDRAQFLKKEIDKDLETERLCALIDGLAIHAILNPTRLTKERIISILAHHIDEICHF